MPLGEAVVYLRRAVKRRCGTDITVRIVDVDSSEARSSSWREEGPLPLVIIDGRVFSKGTFSFYKITQELVRLKNKF